MTNARQNPATVTDSYLMGIREGRDHLKRFAPTLDDMRALLANVETNARRGFAREMSDVFKGERDFWKQQIAKVESAA